MTTYTDTILEPGETLRTRAVLSRMLYLWPAIVSVLIAWGLFQINDWNNPNVQFLAFMAFAFCAWLFYRVWNRRKFTEISVTDRRVIFKEGDWFGGRSTNEVNLGAIRAVSLKQTAFGRWFDCGRVIVDDGSWVGSRYLIDSPLSVRASMTETGGS